MTITESTNSVSAVMHAVSGGKFRIMLEDPSARPGTRSGMVLDDDDNVIGSASDYTYGGSGFAVHTRPYGGYVPNDQVEFVRGTYYDLPSGVRVIETPAANGSKNVKPGNRAEFTSAEWQEYCAFMKAKHGKAFFVA